MSTISINTHQYELLLDIFSEKYAKGSGITTLPEGGEIPFEFDETTEFDIIRQSLKVAQPSPILETNIEDLNYIIDALHRREVDLVYNNGEENCSMEHIHQLRFVCNTIDYLETFLPYEDKV